MGKLISDRMSYRPKDKPQATSYNNGTIIILTKVYELKVYWTKSVSGPNTYGRKYSGQIPGYPLTLPH